MQDEDSGEDCDEGRGRTKRTRSCRALVSMPGGFSGATTLRSIHAWILSPFIPNSRRERSGWGVLNREVLLLRTVGLIGLGRTDQPLLYQGFQYLLSKVIPIIHAYMLLDLFAVAGNKAKFHYFRDSLSLHGFSRSLHGSEIWHGWCRGLHRGYWFILHGSTIFFSDYLHGLVRNRCLNLHGCDRDWNRGLHRESGFLGSSLHGASILHGSNYAGIMSLHG
jgi:hypothetical protein